MKHPRKVNVSIRRLHCIVADLSTYLECDSDCVLKRLGVCKSDLSISCDDMILKGLTGDNDEEFHEEDWSYKFYRGRKKN